MAELGSELLSGLAQKFGIAIVGGESETVAVITTYASTEVLKAGIELVLPSVAAGMSFSPTGISLALIQEQLKKLHEKVDQLLNTPKLLAKDKLDMALIAIEHTNFKDAYDEFKIIGTEANKAFIQSQDIEDKIFATKLTLFAHLMTKSYNDEEKLFVPFLHLKENRQYEVVALMEREIDKLEAAFKASKPSITDRLKGKERYKQQKEEIDKIKKAAHPFISIDGLRDFCSVPDDNKVIELINHVISNNPRNLLKPVSDGNETILHRLSYNNRGEVIHNLLEDAVPFIVDEALLKMNYKGHSPLSLAVQFLKDDKYMTQLINHTTASGPEKLLKPVTTNNSNILHELAHENRGEVILKLLKDPRLENVLQEALLKRNDNGHSPLSFASQFLKEDKTLFELINHLISIDPNNLLESVNDGNQTILHKLLLNHRGEFIHKLLNDSRFYNVQQEALQKKDFNDHSPLSLAILLIKEDNKVIELIDLFTLNDPNNLLKPLDDKNETILHQLILRKRGEVIHKLLEDSRFDNVLEEALLKTNDDGHSPLDLASEYLNENNKVIEMINHFTSNNPKNLLKPVARDNQIILHALAQNNRGDIIHKLMEDSRFENVLEEALLKRNDKGHSPLSIATEFLRDDNVLIEMIEKTNLTELSKPAGQGPKDATILDILRKQKRTEVIQKMQWQ